MRLGSILLLIACIAGYFGFWLHEVPHFAREYTSVSGEQIICAVLIVLVVVFFRYGRDL